MATSGNRIRVDVDVVTNVDKNALSSLQQQLDKLVVQGKVANLGDNINQGLVNAGKEAEKLRDILDQSWNSKLNQLDFTKVNNSIHQTWGSAQNLGNALAQGGKKGAEAFANLTSTVLNTNIQLKQSSKILDQFATTFKNTVRYGISSSIFNNFTNSIQKAYDYTKRLDTSLNDIRIVSNKTADDMERFAVQANKAAKALGQSTLDYTNASLIYYQQGLSDDEVEARTNVTLKAANVTGQTAQEVSEQLTAVWNGYNVSVQQSEEYVDKLAAVAASTAADLEELSTGMSKVASAANAMGVDVDSLNAQLATIVSVTRQAPESVGTALRTIYARMGDIEAGLDEETSLGNYTAQMKELGVNVLNADGSLRDMGDVITEVGNNWKNMSREQQVALAQIMAGTRQYNNLLALFGNWDMYNEALQTSLNSAGELQRQQDIYMESTAAHLQQLQTEAEKTYATLFDQDTVRDFIDILDVGLKGLNSYLTGLGGGMQSLITVGLQLSQLWSKDISTDISRNLQNWQIEKNNQQAQMTQETFAQAMYGENLNKLTPATQEKIKVELDLYEKIKQVRSSLSEEDLQQATNLQEQIGLLTKQIKEEEDLVAEARKKLDITKTDEDIQKQLSDMEANAKEKVKLFDEDEDPRLWKQANDELDKIHAQQEKLNGLTEFQIDELKEQNTQYKNQLDQTIKVGQQTGEIERLYRSVTTAIITINSAMGLWNTWSNENLTIWEKIASTLTTVPVVLFSIVKNWQALTNLKNDINYLFQGIAAGFNAKADEMQAKSKKKVADAIKEVSKAEQAKTKTTAAETLATVADTEATKENTKAHRENAQVKGESNEGEYIPRHGKGSTLPKQALTNTGGTLTTTAAGGSLVNSTMASGTGASTTGATVSGATASLATNVVSTEMMTAGTTAGAGLSTAETAIGEFIAAALPVIAVLAAIAAVCGAVYLAVTKDERELKKAEKTLQEAKDNYNKVAEAHQEFQDTMSNYQQGIDGLKGLKKGTLEYYDAILKANEAAQELIDKYNLVVGTDYTVSPDGLININEEALERTAFESQQSVFRAQANTYDKSNDVIDVKIKQNNEATAKAIEKAIKEQTGEFHNISAEQAEAWLHGEDMTVKEINSNIEKNTKVTQDGSIDITEAISQGLDKNRQLEAEENQNWLLEAQSVIQGFANQEQFDRYNELADVQKEAINSAMAEQLKENQKSSNVVTGDELLRERVIKGGLSSGLSSGWDPISHTLLGGLTNFAIGSYEKSEYEKQLKRQYIARTNAEYGTGGAYGLEYLTNKDGFRLDKDKEKELLESTSMEEVYNALEKGYQHTEQYLDKHLETIRKISYDVANEIDTVTGKFRFDQESQNYISAAITAATSGMQDTFDYSLLSSDELEYVQEKLKEYNIELGDVTPNATKRAAADLAAYNNTLKSQAQALDTTDKALKVYGAVMRDANGNALDFNETNADLIAADYEFNKVFNEGVEVFNNNEDAFEQWIKAMRKDGEKVPYDVADAVGELQIKLEEMLGYEVNPDFLNRYAGDIKKLFSGTADEAEAAYARIQEAALSDTLMTSLGMTADQVSGLLSELSSLEPGAALSDSWNTTLQEMINNAKLTEEQVRAIFENAHIQMPTPDDYELSEETATSEATVTKRTYVGQVPKISGTLFSDMQIVDYVPVNYTVVETAEPVQQKYFKFKGQNVTLKRDRTAKGAAFGTAKSASNFKQSIKNSSSGSKDKPKMEEPLKAELDRYHDVDVQLQLLDKRLAKLQKSQEKAFGKNLIDNYTKQIKLLNKQIDVTNQKLEIAKDEQSELQAKLAKSGVTFASDGTISNYADAYVTQYQKYLAVVNQYNSLTTATQQEKFQSTLDAAKEAWQDFLDNIKNYDTLTTDTIPGLEQDKIDQMDAIIEKQIEEFTMSIEIHLELADATREWNEFKRKVIDGIKDSDILGNAKASLANFYTYLNDTNTGTIQKLTEQVNKTLDQLRQFDQYGESDWYGDNQAQMIEDLKNYYTQLMEEQENLADVQEQIHEAYLDMMDEVQDRFDEQINSYEMIDDLINHDMDVIKMVYGEESYGILDKYYAQQKQNAVQQLDFQRQQVEYWKNVMDESEKGSDAWNKAKENWQSAINEVNSTLKQSIEYYTNSFLNSINEIFYNLNEKMTNGKGLHYLEEEWELINKNSEQYLDNLDAEWAIQKLQGKYLDALDQTDSIAAQRQIRDAMEEQLALLREKDKLSQYDVDRANQMYDILLKQIALQEAQQNKSKMRLRRDSQGNYTYQFVSDEDQTSKLQDELGDLYNSLYDFDKENYNKNLNSIYDIWVEFQEKMAEAAQINDPVKRAEMELLVKQQYDSLMNALLEQNLTIRGNLQQSAFDDLAYLYQDDAEKFLQMTDEEKAAFMEDLVPTINSGIAELTQEILDEGGFLPSIEEALNELDQTTNLYWEDVEYLGEVAGQVFGEMQEGVDQNIQEMQKLLEKNQELIQEQEKELKAVKNVCDQLDTLLQKYNKANEAAQQASKDAYEYFKTIQSKAAEAAESVGLIKTALSNVSSMVNTIQEAINKLKSSYKNTTNNGNITNDPSKNNNIKNEIPTGKGIDALTEATRKWRAVSGVVANGKGHDDIVGVGDTIRINKGFVGFKKPNGVSNEDVNYQFDSTAQWTVTGIRSGSKNPIQIQYGKGNLGNPHYTYVPLRYVQKYFDTGGYTGDWHSKEGRVAMLHQKELVLNATDTQNILNAVTAIRGLSSSMLSQLAAVSSNTNTGSLDNAFEQNVHITATFPNVVSSHEVEDAINNLVNVATQRVGQRR